MISFNDFIPSDNGPIYQQIILYIKQGLVAGTIADGDEAPSRRALSALLGVNPNTVQKSYKLLEDEGILSSTPGAKSYITADEKKISAIRSELIGRSAREVIKAMKLMKVSRDDALGTISALWDEDEYKE